MANDPDRHYVDRLLRSVRTWLRRSNFDTERRSFCMHSAEAAKTHRYPAALQHAVFCWTVLDYVARKHANLARYPWDTERSVPFLEHCGPGDGHVTPHEAARDLQHWVPHRLDWPTVAIMLPRMVAVSNARLYRHGGPDQEIPLGATVLNFVAVTASTEAHNSLAGSDGVSEEDWTESPSLAEAYEVLANMPLLPLSDRSLGHHVIDHLVLHRLNRVIGHLDDILESAISLNHPRSFVVLSELERLANMESDLSRPTEGPDELIVLPQVLYRLRDALAESPHIEILHLGSRQSMSLARPVGSGA